jgi:hypothetical protein
VASTGAPTLSVAAVGRPVTVTLPRLRPTPAVTTYQWRLDGAPVAGATAATYTPAAADLGHRISVVVTGARDQVATGTFTSASVVVAAAGVLSWSGGRPALRGSGEVGSKLRLKGLRASAFSPAAASLTYQWQRNGKPVKGATSKSYVIKGKDRGKKVVCVVTAHLAGWTEGTVTSKAVRVPRR